MDIDINREGDMLRTDGTITIKTGNWDVLPQEGDSYGKLMQSFRKEEQDYFLYLLLGCSKPEAERLSGFSRQDPALPADDRRVMYMEEFLLSHQEYKEKAVEHFNIGIQAKVGKVMDILITKMLNWDGLAKEDKQYIVRVLESLPRLQAEVPKGKGTADEAILKRHRR